MLKNNMLVFCGDGAGRGHFATLPLPEIQDNQVLVKIQYCGICGTDQDLFSGECSFAKNGEITYPVRLGHEWSGIVVAVGAKVTKFKPGDRVVGDNAICCGKCEACQRGDYSQCRNTKNVGTIDPVYDGAFAEYFVLPEYHTYKIPDSLSLKEAALCEPLSVAYGATRNMDITRKSNVAVIGTGCIGLSAVILAKCAGAGQIFLIGRNAGKLQAAEHLGAVPVNIKTCDPVEFIREKTDNRGVDFVIECSGAEGTITQAMEIAMRKGKIALIGFYEKEEKNINIDKIVSKELNIVGIMGEYGNIGAVLDILGKHRPNMLPLITDELPFAECERAFLRKNFPNAIKIMISIGGEDEWVK